MTRTSSGRWSANRPSGGTRCVCEGEKTEKRYLEKFARHHNNARIKVEVAGETGVPFSLVEFAKKYKREIEKRANRQMDQSHRLLQATFVAPPFV